SRRPRRGAAGGCLDRRRQTIAIAPAPAAVVGGVLAGTTQVLFVLVAYRLLAPGSEWRLHREWFQRSALADLLGEDAGLAEIHKLYRCHDRLLAHKQAVFDHLAGRWRDLFNIRDDVLLTYFEADPPFPEGDKGALGTRAIIDRIVCRS